MVVHGERWERWKNKERENLQLERKSFSLTTVDGLMKISELHHSGIRVILLNEIQVTWLKNRLLWKSHNPGIDTRKLWCKGKDSTLALFEKSNRWGSFISAEISRPSEERMYMVIPGGTAGNLWKQFANWLYPEDVPVSSTLSSSPPINRSYAEVLLGVSHDRNISVIDSLKSEIVFLNARVLELTEQFCSFAKQQETHRQEVSRSDDAVNSSTDQDDDTLVPITAVAEDAECQSVEETREENNDVMPDVVREETVGCVVVSENDVNHMVNGNIGTALFHRNTDIEFGNMSPFGAVCAVSVVCPGTSCLVGCGESDSTCVVASVNDVTNTKTQEQLTPEELGVADIFRAVMNEAVIPETAEAAVNSTPLGNRLVIRKNIGSR